MKVYEFNENLFRKLGVALDMTVRAMTREMGVSENTWRGWRRGGDLPLSALLKICNALCIPVGHFICAGEEKVLVCSRAHYVMDAKKFRKAKFLNKEFGEEVTVMQGRQVMEFCALAGMSATTFYKNFRNVEEVGSCLGVKTFLRICNKTMTYPMDFLISEGVDVPVLKGYSRRGEKGADVLARRNIDVLSHNARLVRELDREKAKVKELTAEVERLKAALGAKRMETVMLEEELDGRRMRAAEGELRVES